MLTSSAVTFGDLLKQLRKRGGMTQADLAAAVGYSVPFISNLELNQRLPNVDAVVQGFIPALGLQDEPHLAARLVALAAEARGERSPESLERTQATRLVAIHEQTALPRSWPAPPTELIGRDHDVKTLCNRLLGHMGRLMTLIGPPGLGKTRLALAVGEKLNAVFSDGVYFVPLAAISEADLVAPAIVSALGIEESETQPPQERLIGSLRRKQTLLILDNFEQILPAAPLVANLLAACPDLHMLVTSRERLHLRAEQRYRLSPLDPASAVTLFVQRAQAADADFTLTHDNQTTLLAICRHLDFLPLAIELCAARVDLLTPEALLTRLRDRRLDLLADGPQDLPARQRTLRDAIRWSYLLLNPQEQSLFRSLGVFVDGFALETLVDLGCDEMALRSLVNKSLVQVAGRDQGAQRFLLLETVREYAWEQLAAHGEDAAMQRRHAEAYLRLAEEAARHLRGPDQAVWLDRLAVEQANLRAALTVSLAAGQGDTAARLGIALWRFWYVRGHYQEGGRWLQTLVAQTERAEPRAQLLYGQGMLARRTGDMALVADSLAACLALFRELDDPRGIASALRGLGFARYLQNDEAGARVLFEEALVRFRALDDPEGIAVTLDNLAYIRRNWSEGQRLFEESLALRRRSGNLRGVAMSLAGLATVVIGQGDYAAARRYAQEQLEINEMLGNQDGISNALDQLGSAAFAEGDYTIAQRHYEKSVHLCQEAGERLLLPGVRHRLGLVMMKLGDYGRAQALFEQSLASFHERVNVFRVANVLEAFAGLALVQGRAQRALCLLGAAASFRDPTQKLREAPVRQAENAHIQAAARQMLGDEEAASAWEAGQAMTFDEAVAYALAEQMPDAPEPETAERS